MERTLTGLLILAAAIAVGVLAAVMPDQRLDVPLMLGAAAAPIGALIAVRGRLGSSGSELRAALGGAMVGPVVAIVGHAVVAGFAFAFFLGFADAGLALLESLRVDPRLQEMLTSPWLVVLLVDLAVVAPITEEAGKALGAHWLAPPADRRGAFVAGVAAGTGFAVVENLMYAGLAAAFGGPWRVVVLARIAGSAVHPLATALVMLGIQDAREARGIASGLRGYASGVGIHALWNGSVVVLAVAASASGGRVGTGPQLVQLVFATVLGAVLAAVLWSRAGELGGPSRDESGSRSELAGWIVLGAALVVPVAVIVLTFPSFRLGPPP